MLPKHDGNSPSHGDLNPYESPRTWLMESVDDVSPDALPPGQTRNQVMVKVAIFGMIVATVVMSYVLTKPMLIN